MDGSRVPGASALRIAASLLFLAAAAVGAGDVIIDEIHYEAPDKTKLEEFVELYNAGGGPVDLSGWYFSNGIEFVFPPGTVLEADGYIAVAEDPASLEARFPGIRTAGPFAGHLSNDGERLVLRAVTPSR